VAPSASIAACWTVESTGEPASSTRGPSSGDRAATESSHRLEAPFVAGERHGTSRAWYDTGGPRGEYVYERGRLVDARGWTEAGNALSAPAARAQADRDRRRDDRFIESLERQVAVHKPRCM